MNIKETLVKAKERYEKSQLEYAELKKKEEESRTENIKLSIVIEYLTNLIESESTTK